VLCREISKHTLCSCKRDEKAVIYYFRDEKAYTYLAPEPSAHLSFRDEKAGI